jgi:small GTP-binding protein
MGVLYSLYKKLTAIQEARIIMVGLDNAGKTTILNRFKFAEYSATIPTVGFNLENIKYKNLSMDVWDIGGQEKIRKLWRHYYTNVQGVIFVIDSTDKERLEEVKEELILLNQEDELKNLPLLLYANKQDNKGMKSKELAQTLQLTSIIKGREWYVQECSARFNEGLYEGLDWLVEKIKT